MPSNKNKIAFFPQNMRIFCGLFTKVVSQVLIDLENIAVINTF